MRLIIKIFALVISVMFVLVGCSFNTSETEIKNARIFIAGDFKYSLLLEIIDGNIFEVILFNKAGVSYADLQEYFQEYLPFDETLLDDFFANPRMLDYGLVTNRNFDLERGYTRFIRNKGSVKFSEEEAHRVQYLIRNVARTRADRRFERPAWSGRMLWIWAIIDYEMYWTLYADHIPQEHNNLELLLLTHELINLSPIDLDSEIFY